MANDYELRICPGPEEVASAAAELFAVEHSQAIQERGRFRVALSGGSSPRRTYQLLAETNYRPRIDWSKTDLFWGDERYVPPEHRDSNYRMVREALLQHVPLGPENVHRVPTEIDPPQAAAGAYEKEIRRTFGLASGVPSFDLVFLGLGGNGHTASLFPGSPLLHEASRLAAAEFVAEADSWRLTLTLPVLNQGRTIAFLVAGEEKADILREVLRGPYTPEKLPAQLIRAQQGKLLWIVDRAAASKLGPGIGRPSAA